METWIVLLSYVLASLLAIFALYWCGKAKWQWHLLSFAAAICIGIMPPLPYWSGPAYDIGVGSLFLFLLIWGVGEPIYDALHLPHHMTGTHATVRRG